MTTNQIADLIISDIEFREPNQRNCTIDSDNRVNIVYDLTTFNNTDFGTPYITPDEIVVSKSIYISSAGYFDGDELKEYSYREIQEIQNCVNEKIQ